MRDTHGAEDVLDAGHPALTAALVVGLSCGLWNYSFGALLAPLYIWSPAAGLLPVAAFAAITTLKVLAAWLCLGWPLRRFLGLKTMPLAAALGATFWLPFYLDASRLLAPWTLGESRVLVPVALLSAAAGVGVYLAASEIARHPTFAKHAGRAAALGPFVLTAVYFVVWSAQWAGAGASGRVTQMIVGAGFLLLITYLWRRSTPARANAALAGLLAAFAAGSAVLPQVSGSASEAQGVMLGADLSPRLVILLSVDTLRWDALPMYSPEAVDTPSLSELAGDSIVFQRAYSAGPWTKPGVFSFLTGTSPWVHGVVGFEDRLPEGLPTLAERMGEAGYWTAGIGHNPWLTQLGSHGGSSRGMDTFDFSPQINVPQSRAFQTAAWMFRGPMRHLTETEDLTDRAIALLRGGNDRATFLWLHYFDPHAPFQPPAEFLPKSGGVSPYEGGFDVHEYDLKSGKLRLSAEQRDWVRRLYDAEIRYVDASIGRLIEDLKERGVYEDALIVLTSDHGEEFWEHGNVHHAHSLYEELIRVPLMIKLPNSAARSTVEAAVSTVSLPATILELCGIDYAPEEFSGRSLAAFWADSLEVPGERTIFSTGLTYYEQREAVIFDGFKYIEFLESDRRELFDLRNDPGERVNRASLDPGRVRRGRELLAAQRQDARRIRRLHGLADPQPKRLEDDHLRFLRSLGYL